jgi:selenocysteine-specific elongation factor
MPDRKKRVIGTAGHIDHGKTALVRALTGVDCDRLPEEKRRGITIDLGFASWITEEYQIGFVDVPGHERFVKNMLAGVGGIDCALLVVAADESIMPQTREHLAICRLLEIPAGVVAITKSDLVERDIIDLVRLEIEELVSGSFLEGKPIVPVSSVTSEGIPELQAALIAAVASVPDRDHTTRVFRLPIDRAFTLKGFGSIVTGTALSGELRSDADVEILPSGLRSRARTIQVHGAARELAVAGERTSINLADLALDQLERGEQVVEPRTLTPSQIITARLNLLPDSRPLKDQARVRFHHLAAELLGSVRLIAADRKEVAPGASEFVQIRLESPVVATAGDRFVIRRYSPATTIGGGVILDAHLPRLSRGTRPDLLETLARGSLAERASLLARLAGASGLSLADLEARTGIRQDTLRRELTAKVLPELAEFDGPGGRRWLHRDTLVELRRRAMAFLQKWFEANRTSVSVPKSEFVQKLVSDAADSALVNFVLQDLQREKIIAVAGDSIEVPGRSKTLGGAEGELARLLEERFRSAALQPPPVSELIHTIQQRPKVIEGVVSYLVKQGILVRIADGVYLHRDVVTQARAKMATRKGQTIDVGGFKDLFGLSRKVAIPLLELFDREGVTRREGDVRQVL